MENVLVTGGAGFIGSHLVETLLNKGTKKIVVLDNLSCGYEENIPSSKNVDFVKGDIRDVPLVNDLVKKSDMIFHLAEFIPETKKYGPGHIIKFSIERPLEDFDVNTRGTLVILDAARKYGRKVVFTSTAAVYGNYYLKNIMENDVKLPVSPYGASKLCAETFVDLYSRVFELPTVIARFFNIYGPRQKKYVMYDMMLKLLKKPERLSVLGSGKEERDFVYVQDAVDALLLLATHPEAEGQVFNIGTGISTSILRVVELLKQILDLDIEIEVSGKSWPGDLKTLVANIDKIKGLGYEPKFSVEKGLEKFVTWFLNNYSDAQINL